MRVHLGPPALAQLHHRARVLARRDDGGLEHGLVDVVDAAGVGQLGRVVHVELGAVGQEGPVGHAGRGGDEREVELALEALAHDLHVEQAEEPAAEADAQGMGGLGLEGEARRR